MFKKIEEKISNIIQDMWEDYYMYDKEYSDDAILDIVIKELKELKRERIK